MPLTTDYPVVQAALDNLQPGQLEDGTAIGTAIATAANRLKDAPGQSRVLVLLTDGVNNRGSIDPRTAAKAAAAVRHQASTASASARRAWRRCRSGAGCSASATRCRSVEIDDALLTDVSTATGGRYFRARDPAALQRITEQINALERTPVRSRTYVRYAELFRWPLGAMLVALAAELVLARVEGAAAMIALDRRHRAAVAARPRRACCPSLFVLLLRRAPRSSAQRRLARLGALDVVRRLVPAAALSAAAAGARCGWRSPPRSRESPSPARAGAGAHRRCGPRGVDLVLAVDASLSMMATRREADPARAREAGDPPAARA